MGSISLTSIDIFEIYRQYCDIISRMQDTDNIFYGPDEESQKLRFTREALSQLFEVVESKLSARVSIIEEIYKLMLRLGLMAEFSRFYDFVFFICRENGQKNITVSRAVMAWRLVLAGRFRLLDQWCNFIEENQRHNISEDTWRQVLVFSHCVHENLEEYDSEGAWPVLIDDFVEHMYRIRGSLEIPKVFYDYVASDLQPIEGSLSGLKNFPGTKRKSRDDLQMEIDFWEGHANPTHKANSKRRHIYLVDKSIPRGQDQLSKATYDFNDKDRQRKNLFGCTKSLNAIEGSLSKGFARLLSGHSAI